jgi:hypothetical protein
MTQAQQVRQMALHMRELASSSCFPIYIEKLSQAADDLERRAAEAETPAPSGLSAKFGAPSYRERDGE